MRDLTYNEQRAALRWQAKLAFSPKYLSIMRLAADGMTDKEIAAEIQLTKRGVGWRWREIFSRLPAINRTHAVAIAFRMGLIT